MKLELACLAFVLTSCASSSAPSPSHDGLHGRASTKPVEASAVALRRAACTNTPVQEISDYPISRAALSKVQRQEIADEFTKESGIPWDNVSVTALGHIAQARIHDWSGLLEADASKDEQHMFWRAVLEARNRASGLNPTAQQANECIRCDPYWGYLIVGASSLEWHRTPGRNDAILYGGHIMPTSLAQLSDEELTCMSEIGLPFQVIVPTEVHACPQCNAERGENKLLEVGGLGWTNVQSFGFVEDSGRLTVRFGRRPDFRRHAQEVAKPDPHLLIELSAVNQLLSSKHLDAISGEEFAPMTCQTHPLYSLLCASERAILDKYLGPNAIR